jgi:hypothetical protein
MIQNNFSRQIILLCCLLKISSNSFSQQTNAEWNFPNNPDNAIVDVALPMNSGIILTTQGGTGLAAFNQGGATSFAANATGWQSGMNSKWWEISFATTGLINLTVSSKQFSSATGPRDFKIQYRIGTGVWNDLPGANSIVLATNFISGVVTAVPLPPSCENQASVSLRWIMTSNSTVAAGTVAAGGNSRIDDINISRNIDSYFRSVASGDWKNIATWESSSDNIFWNAALMPPSNFAKTITIRNTHTVSINSNVNLDETIVENGATLNWTSFYVNIFNGSGIDLQVNGTFIDGCSNSANFSTGATWNLGSAATIIKTNMGSSNNWRDAYDGGIANINPSATFIIRKVTGNNPSVSSLTMYYPNLIIENYTSIHWIASGFSGFQGSTTTIFVKGSMDVGGTGTSTVEFENSNTNAAPTIVMGNLIIRATSTLRNYGTGFELFSDLICNGNILYDANGMRKFQFSGSAVQSISGTGNLSIYNMVMNKNLNSVVLNKPVKIDSNLTFNTPGGKIISNVINKIIFENNSTVSGVSNTGFVDGVAQKIGNQQFTFPIGKNNCYRPISIGASAPVAAVTFWNENFGTGCNGGQLASNYNLWGVLNTGVNDSGANDWFISATENGGQPGICSSSCGNNQTLHVGTTYPVIDQGANYFDSSPVVCPVTTPCSNTDKMAVSPIINCSGKSNITIAFNYLLGGELTNDHTFLWYFDGLVWNQLIDLPKTLCCGNVLCDGSLPGMWTNYSITLPATSNNNANVRIGFRWINNANGIQINPSFAVDDMVITGTENPSVFTAEYFRNNPQIDFNNNVNPFIHHISNCEYWILEQNAGSTSRNVTLSWDANSGGVNSLSDVTIANFTGTAWADAGNGSTTGNITTGTITSATALNNFGPFTLASVSLQNPLPIELVNFTAVPIENQVTVSWKTASEHNTDSFKILRSKNGIEFIEIGVVKAAGNSSDSQFYFFDDLLPLHGTSYYRLKQIDTDGIFVLSEIISVNFQNTIETVNINFITIDYTNETINLNLSSSKNKTIQFNLYDFTGRKIISQYRRLNSGIQTITIPLKLLSKSLYVIEIIDEQQAARRLFGY